MKLAKSRSKIRKLRQSGLGKGRNYYRLQWTNIATHVTIKQPSIKLDWIRLQVNNIQSVHNCSRIVDSYLVYDLHVLYRFTRLWVQTSSSISLRMLFTKWLVKVKDSKILITANRAIKIYLFLPIGIILIDRFWIIYYSVILILVIFELLWVSSIKFLPDNYRNDICDLVSSSKLMCYYFLWATQCADTERPNVYSLFIIS